MKSYRVYDLMTGEELGRYETEIEASMKHKNEPITIIYRPSKRRSK